MNERTRLLWPEAIVSVLPEMLEAGVQPVPLKKVVEAWPTLKDPVRAA